MIPTFTERSIGQGGTKLYPGSIAAPTPQTFDAASPPTVKDGFGVSRHHMGKLSEDRIAVSSTAPPSHDPPDDDPLPPAKGPQPLIRRITMAPPKDDDES